MNSGGWCFLSNDGGSFVSSGGRCAYCNSGETRHAAYMTSRVWRGSCGVRSGTAVGCGMLRGGGFVSSRGGSRCAYCNCGKTRHAACMASRVCRGSCGVRSSTAMGCGRLRHCNSGRMAAAADMACNTRRYYNSGRILRTAMTGRLFGISGTAVACCMRCNSRATSMVRHCNSGRMFRATCVAGRLSGGSTTAMTCGMLCNSGRLARAACMLRRGDSCRMARAA